MQFKQGAKEADYLQLMATQKTPDELEKIVSFIYRDRLSSCLSNYAFGRANQS
jgi:hypothetical protein